MENGQSAAKTRKEYYEAVNEMGKKEFTFLKMQEYGFWPPDLPTPYEKQANESPADYRRRKELLQEYERIAAQIAALYSEKDAINGKLKELKSQYDQTWDEERIRQDIAQKIMQESIARRAARKEERALAKEKASAAWQKHKAENIIFIGRGYSASLADRENDQLKLASLGLPIIADDHALAELLGIEYRGLRFLAYHRDVETVEHYHRYAIPKRNGSQRTIAAPKPLLKEAQRKILTRILEQITIAEPAHGFLKGKSVISGAATHVKQPALLINIDLENFFPTITFPRIRGLFKSFGYSGYISSLLAMLCTYCERVPVEVKGQTKYVKASERILPQGSPASPMITNIICRGLDARLSKLAADYHCTYTRYADDLSFSFAAAIDGPQIKQFVFYIQCIVHDEGLKINKAKTRYLKKNNRQCVTGVVINNEEIGVPKAWVKRMRAAIHNANRQMGSADFDAHKIYEIAGMAAWLSSVNPVKYKKIIDEAQRLVQSYKNSCQAK